MELKRSFYLYARHLTIVLIEPLWNWNLIDAWLKLVKMVLIEPLWNWNDAPTAAPEAEAEAF